MGDIIDLCHYKRAQRLLRLFINRFGIENFLAGGEAASFRLEPARIHDAVGLCSAWLELRMGRPPSPATQKLMFTYLRRQLIQALARKLVDAGY